MSNDLYNPGLDDLLMHLDYRLTPNGWCRKYSIFAERMEKIRGPALYKSEPSELEDLYFDGLTSDYDHQIYSCKGLLPYIGDRLTTQCFIFLKIGDGVVIRSLQCKGELLHEDKMPYKEFYDLALREFVFYPKILPVTWWRKYQHSIICIILLAFIALSFVLGFLRGA